MFMARHNEKGSSLPGNKESSTLVDIVRYPQKSVRGYPFARTRFGRKSAEQTGESIWSRY
jgi:hypothetical protein